MFNLYSCGVKKEINWLNFKEGGAQQKNSISVAVIEQL